MVSKYAMNQNLIGKQYFYGFQVGGTYKIADNFSVFGGLRGVLANCAYEGAITGISGDVTFVHPVSGTNVTMPGAAQSADLVLDCSQSGFGITPIIGVDWNLGKLNLAAKYEFRTKINLENESKNSANLDAMAAQVPAVAVYADGAKVRSDIPAIMTLGAQYEITDNFRAMVGGVYYWDKDAKGTPIKEGKNTWEANFGIEWDVNDKILLSCGAQRTQYGFDDTDMADTNFNTSSYAVAIGGAYKFSEKMKLNVGYMHSFYDNHKFKNANGTACDYTRKNDAVGVSLDITF
jgi:long-chain fatty acid transport protein